MSMSIGEEVAASNREYWTRQIIIRRLRLHDERNQQLLRSEILWLTKLTAGTIAIVIVGLARFITAMRWL